ITQGETITTFVYDGDGGRVKKIVGSTTTRYISKLYECDNTNCTRFIWTGSTRIATIASNGAVNYWHGDHLGSSSVITDAAGNKVQTITYYPYGGTNRNESSSNPVIDVPYKYTGKELDVSTGLYYYEARYYDPTLGRFISADTIVPHASDPQSYNRYSYVRNNPLLYIDPTGHKFKFSKFLGNPIVRGVGWAFAPGAMAFLDKTTRPYAIATAAVVASIYTGGAAAPAFASLTGSVFAGAVIGGAVGGAVGGVVGSTGSALSGNHVNWGTSILAGAAGGALGGAVGLSQDSFLTLMGRGVTGGVTSAIRGGNFGIGFAIGFGTATAFEAYTALTGFAGVNPGPGTGNEVKGVGDPSAKQFLDNVGVSNPTEQALQAAQQSFCCNEGSTLMRAAGMLPFVNAMGGGHDFLTDSSHLGMNVLTNIPTMLPMYGLTVAAGINQLTVDGQTFSLTAPLLTQIRVR
ncbi:MAG: RHS repeat-associated core domain-containing protein, partial [Nitrospirae bacterium]|nr:RHS repeat-associated core domain-containing protein [Nitrospirota bacterium]